MSNEELSNYGRRVRLGAIMTIVLGLVSLAAAWWWEARAEKHEDIASVWVLTKARPVVGEWVSVPTADAEKVAISRIEHIMAVIGLVIGACLLLMGAMRMQHGMEQANTLTRVERLEAEIARLSTERSGATGASLPVEPGQK